MQLDLVEISGSIVRTMRVIIGFSDFESYPVQYRVFRDKRNYVNFEGRTRVLMLYFASGE